VTAHSLSQLADEAQQGLACLHRAHQAASGAGLDLVARGIGVLASYFDRRIVRPSALLVLAAEREGGGLAQPAGAEDTWTVAALPEPLDDMLFHARAQAHAAFHTGGGRAPRRSR
jgi:hypothetical protein